MRGVSLAMLLVACNSAAAIRGGTDGSPDGGFAPPGSGCSCSIPPAGLAPCGTTACGNNQIDTCYVTSPLGCHCVYPMQEPCDGSASQSCSDHGFYGDGFACTRCQPDTSACNACAPGDVSCATLPAFGLAQIAVSGTSVALLGASEIKISDGIAVTHEAFISDALDIAAVPTGWLVATGQSPALSTFDVSGTQGDIHPLPPGATNPKMAYGVAGLAVVVWSESIMAEWHVYAAIVDTTGVTVVPASELFVGDDLMTVTVTTDGTSFFVGAQGQLARIAPNGTHTITSGFPVVVGVSSTTTVTWSGSTGWFVTQSGISATAQRFDASGAPLGAPIEIDLGVWEFVADGDELLGLLLGNKISVIRIDSTGATSVPNEVGGGTTADAYLARFGDNLLVAWSRQGHLQLALTVP